jgi:hypothetical protein
MVSRRLFDRLDRARLDRTTLLCAWPDLCKALDALRHGHLRYGADGRVVDLSRACQHMVAVLNRSFEIAPKPTVVRDRPRPHRRRGGRIVYELHGLCDPEGPLELYTRTAAHARPVALKTLLNTLLHEWVHHFDFCSFGDSVHCSGFYERLAQVYRPARDALDKSAAAH